MNKYSILVFLHVASVIVWIGVGSTIALAALYAQRGRDQLVLERLGGWVGWLTPRVLAPSALAALGFGIAAAHEGHWPHLFFFQLGEAAFVISFLLTVLFRLPLLRRVRRGSIRPDRVARLTLALALVELTVLFLAVADMVAKPTTSDTATLVTGGAILAVTMLVSIAVGFSGRSKPTRDLVEIAD
jgi:hypothetical protein